MKRAIPASEGSAFRRVSATHDSERKKTREKRIGLNTPTDAVPVCERLFRLTYQVESFAAREAMPWIVVRLVAGLLKFDERARNPDEFRLQCMAT